MLEAGSQESKFQRYGLDNRMTTTLVSPRLGTFTEKTGQSLANQDGWSPYQSMTRE